MMNIYIYIKVIVVDMSSGETIEARLVSRIDDYFHREPVRSLQWVWDAEDNEFVVASSSSDGKVLWWRLRNQLKFPLCGSKLSLQRQSEFFFFYICVDLLLFLFAIFQSNFFFDYYLKQKYFLNNLFKLLVTCETR
jgi:WD40 repeat protein